MSSIGSKVIGGRYEVLKPLGEGGGGVCYLVSDRQAEGVLLALKTLRDDQGGKELREAFLRECALLRRLEHPHLARVIDFGGEAGLLYYVSEYVEGDRFDIACQKRDWNAVFALVVQGAWALHALHEQGIVHRDLKPENILVGKVHVPREPDRQDRLVLKIIDFGLAVAGAAHLKSAEQRGTLGYMAPEVLAGRGFDRRADLYSWGVVLYQMAFGRLPFSQAANFVRYLEMLSSQEVDLRPLEESGEIPEGILAILRRLLARDPGQRLQDALEIIRILNETEGENFPLRAETGDKAPSAALPAQSLPAAYLPSTPQSCPRGRLASGTFSPVSRKTPKRLSSEEALAGLLQLIRSGRRDEAWAWAEDHLAGIDRSGNGAVVEKFYGAAVYVLVEQGDYPRAEDLLKKMERHPALRGRFSFELALLKIQLAYRRGDLAGAELLMKNVPPEAVEAASPDERARFENDAARIAQKGRRYAEAAGHFERAAALSQQTGRKDHQLSALANAASLHQDQGRWRKAYTLLREAQGISRELGHKAHGAAILNNLGNLLLTFGRLREAEAAFSESLTLARAEDLKPLVAYNLYMMTVVEEARGNRERVARYLEEALKFAETLGESQPVLQAELARGYFYLGQKNFQACAEAVGRLRSKAGPSGRRDYLLQADWLEAKLRIGEKTFDRFPVAQWLERIKEDARTRNLKNLLWQIASDQGDLARAQKKIPQARSFYEEALRILEGLQPEIPEEFQKSFWRDRKKEKIRRALEELERSEPALDPVSSFPISFDRWTSINRRLLTQHDIDRLLAEILDAAIGLTDAERGFVILSDVPRLEIRAARNLDQEALEKEEGKISRTIAEEVLRKGEPTIVLDALEDERFSQAPSVHALQIRSVLCAPLKAGPRTIGLIYLDNRFRRGVFHKEHLPLFLALADQASLTLEHARLHRENRERIVELERSRETIEKLNARLEEDLLNTRADFEALSEGMRREHEETALRYTYDQIIGESPRLKSVLKILDRVVDSRANVYLHGESGTGKELFARALHFNGPRKERPFVSENCAALAENLLESELFGHVRGAFTGADRDRLGLFHAANGGTLFLDEVGEMSPGMQAKLLRVLQEGEVRQVGGREYRKVDVRVVSASNKDLKALADQGKFRKDLYYRLVVVRLDLPPLKDRREDIPLLVNKFLETAAASAGRKAPRIRRSALKVFLGYSWPGNIRELQNEIQRLIALGGDPIGPEMISPEILAAFRESKGVPLQAGIDHLVADVERKAIAQAWEKFRGNKVQMARALKISRKTLYAKLEIYKIQPA